MQISTQNITFSEIEYLAAENILRDIAPEHFDDSDFFSSQISDQTFDDTFQASRIRKPNFMNCSFSGTQFDGNDATDSSMVACQFTNTVFRDVCMNYSNLTASKFQNVMLDNCGCSNCNFSGTEITGSKATGCDFMRSFFYKTRFSASTFTHCSFEEAEFKDSEFLDIDLSQSGLDYAFLDTTLFANTILPFWGVLRSFGGLNALRHSVDVKIKYSADSKAITVPELISKLEELQPYFYRKKQFFVLANVYIFLGQQKNALTCILEGLRKYIQCRDFRSIRHLCELAARNRFFQKRQLRQLYDLLISEDAISGMNHHEHQLYQMEIQGIKHLLVENPYGLPRITILIQTSFPCDDYATLAVFLRFVDKSIKQYLPQCIYHISIYRNSPPQIELSICENLPELILYLSTFALAIFGLGNKSVAFLKEICQTNGIRLDNQEKKVHLKAVEEQEALKTERMRLENELLQLQISKQRSELEKDYYKTDPKQSNLMLNQEDIAPTIAMDLPQSALVAGQIESELSAEIKQQIPAITFSIQTDDPTFTAPRQGVLIPDQ